MKKNVKVIHVLIRSAGSIINIFPETDFQRFVPKQTASARMYGHWSRTGKHIQNAMNRFADEQKKS